MPFLATAVLDRWSGTSAASLGSSSLVPAMPHLVAQGHAPRPSANDPAGRSATRRPRTEAHGTDFQGGAAANPHEAPAVNCHMNQVREPSMTALHRPGRLLCDTQAYLAPVRRAGSAATPIMACLSRTSSPRLHRISTSFDCWPDAFPRLQRSSSPSHAAGVSGRSAGRHGAAGRAR